MSKNIFRSGEENHGRDFNFTCQYARAMDRPACWFLFFFLSSNARLCPSCPLLHHGIQYDLWLDVCSTFPWAEKQWNEWVNEWCCDLIPIEIQCMKKIKARWPMKHAVSHTAAILKDPCAAVPHLSTSGSCCLMNQLNTPSATSLQYKQFSVRCLSQIVSVVTFPGCIVSVSSVCTCSCRANWPPS